jgi:hypothetical protein
MAMEKFEYFGGLPEIGIVPRAPHAGPLLRRLYEQEHGRGGFAGRVSHTYHLYFFEHPGTTDARFTHSPTRLADVRAAAERLAGARDTLRPTGEGDAGA